MKTFLLMILLLTFPVVSLFASGMSETGFFFGIGIYVIIYAGINIIVAVVLYLIFRYIFKVRGSLILMILATLIGSILAFMFSRELEPHISNSEIINYAFFYGIPAVCALLAMTVSVVLRKSKES